MPDDIAAQIEDLQTRVAYQDHTLQQLNDVIADQQKKLDAMSRALQSLAHQFQDWREQDGHEPPPHY